MSVLLIKASHHRYSTKSFIVVFCFMFKRCLYPDIRFAVLQDLLKPQSLLFSAHDWQNTKSGYINIFPFNLTFVFVAWHCSVIPVSFTILRTLG